MEATKWTEAKIQKALTSPLYGVVSYLNFICIPNVNSTRVVYTGEADLIAITKAGYVKEFEIKVSLSDLKKDKLKMKHNYWGHPKHLISELWYAMPEGLAPLEEIEKHIPEYAGIVYVYVCPRGITRCKVARLPKQALSAKKLEPKDVVSLARLGCIRFWTYWCENKLEVPHGTPK